MDQWDDLLLTGGFAPREVLLRGLALEQVSSVPDSAPHSIYQELWHTTEVLVRSLDHGRAALENFPREDHFPPSPEPDDLTAWQRLVDKFLAYSRQAVARSQDGAWLSSAEPVYDSTWRDALEFLAVHTAYHLGRIVLLRQLIGSWPPPRSS